MGECAVCEGAATSFCTRCKTTYYCDRECFNSDYANHTLTCRVPSDHVGTRVAFTKRGLSVNSNLICIRDSKVSGRGVFAMRDIPAGTLIAEEKAVVSFYKKGLAAALGTMSDSTEDLLLQLRTPQLKTLKAVMKDSVCMVHSDTYQSCALYGNNALDSSGMCAGVHHVFVLERMFNHSCAPNVHRSIHDGRVYITTNVDICDGDELFLCYYHACYSLPKRDRDVLLPFKCKCSVCVSPVNSIERARRTFQKRAAVLLSMPRTDVRMKSYEVLTDMFDDIMRNAMDCLPHITTGPYVVIGDKVLKNINLNPLYCDTIIMCIAKLLESGLTGSDYRYTLKKLLDISIVITEYRRESHTDNYISHVVLRSAVSRIE